VTRDTEPSISRDALIIAAEVSSGPWLDLATARRVDADLTAIRAGNAVLSGVHARDNADPKTLLVRLDAAAPWRADWSRGFLTTGEAALDAALTDWRARTVSELGDPSDGTVVYVLTFDQWMNVEKLAAALRPLSPRLLAVEVNGYFGDGDDIEVTDTGYRFRKGWGDCPAGCVNHHYWSAVRTGSSWNITESGTPLEG
jgi:hypothetical protein